MSVAILFFLGAKSDHALTRGWNQEGAKPLSHSDLAEMLGIHHDSNLSITRQLHPKAYSALSCNSF